jgi:hypothetical protein
MEGVEHIFRHRARRNAPVPRPERAPDRTQSQIRAAALVRDGKAVAADRVNLAADAREADAAGPDDHDRAIAARMRAQTSNRRVAGKGDRAEREVMLLEARQHAATVEPGDAEPGPDVADMRGVEPCLTQRFHTGVLDFAQRLLDPDPGR